MHFTPRNLLQAAVASVACAGALTALVQAAQMIQPNIKPGLWEVTTNPKMTGEMPIPEEQLAKMTPEQRTRLEAAMKAGMLNGNKPRVYKDCMTPEKIARGFEMDRGADEASCKRNIVSSTASELTLHDECENPKRKSVTDVHFEIKGGTQMNGKINVVITSSGKTMTVVSTVQGKWLGASCGAVKDAELEK
ncbi:MAG TPA: DUF3617 domain-containing protein [Steroidobacteraceae bacterium]|nr:DUF3617 domain-containing protein [Steroidobacteraceae bacterium]